MAPLILGVLQARMTSRRLPGKVLRPLAGAPMLARQLERLQRSRLITRLLVATSDDPSDDAIEALCAGLGVACFRGALEDVLDRVYRAAAGVAPDHVVRLTADCPLADAEVVDRVISHHLQGGFDYVSNALQPTFPDGLDAEVMRMSCLETAWREAVLPSHREHVTPFLYSHPQRFRIGEVRNHVDLSSHRWTVDEPEDLAFVEKVYAALYPGNRAFGLNDVLALLQARPELAGANARPRNEGLARSQERDRAFVAQRGKGA